MAEPHLRYSVIRPIISVQMYKFMLLPACNNRTRPLGNRTPLPLPLRRDCHTLMTPVRVKLGPSHFYFRTERNHQVHSVLLKHDKKIFTSRGQGPLCRYKVSSAVPHVTGVDVAATGTIDDDTCRVPGQDVGVAVSMRVLRFPRFGCVELCCSDTLVGFNASVVE